MHTLQRTPQQQIVPIAGQRQYSQLNNGVQTHWLDIRAQGDLVIGTAAAAAILNRGSIWAAIDEVGLNENGKDRVLMIGRVARALSEAAAPSKLSAKRLTNTAVGTTHLDETVRIYFAHPYALNPRETVFTEHDTRKLVRAFVKLAVSGGADKIATAGGGGGTVALNNLTFDVVQGYDAQEPGKPYFIPQVRDEVEPVTGASKALRHYLKTDYPIRAIVISQEDTNLGEVSDILNGLVLRGDNRDIIGPSEIPLAELVMASEYEFGGDSDYPNDAHLVLNFQTLGRLKNVLGPHQDANLRAELDVQKSATGTGASQVRFTIVELVPDTQLCAPVPFPI